MDVALTYKIEWEKELTRRTRLGITHLPEPLPHPRHVVIDVRAGIARIVGPATKEEEAQWDHWCEHRAMFEEELAELQAMLEDPRCELKENLEEEVRHQAGTGDPGITRTHPALVRSSWRKEAACSW
jgi:hypothetical protein